VRTRAMAKARVSKGETRGRATAHKGACVCEGWHEGRRTHDGMRGHARGGTRAVLLSKEIHTILINACLEARPFSINSKFPIKVIFCLYVYPQQ